MYSTGKLKRGSLGVLANEPHFNFNLIGVRENDTEMDNQKQQSFVTARRGINSLGIKNSSTKTSMQIEENVFDYSLNINKHHNIQF